jgi:adenylate cyclase
MAKHMKYFSVIFFVSLLVFAVYLSKLEPFYSFSLRFDDLNFALQTKKASEDVVFIEIDEQRVNRFGRWPWDRDVLAKAIDNLDGSNLLILDMVFSEETKRDRSLALSLQNHANNVCGFFLRDKASSSVSPEQMAILSESSLTRLASQTQGEALFVEGAEAEVNAESILASCTLSATFSTLRDSDQLFREYPLAFVFQGAIYPSIGTQALRMRFNKDILRTSVQHYDIAGHRLISDEKGFAQLNFYPQHSYQRYSFLDLYEKRLTSDLLHDKIVLLGIAEVGVGDMRATPIGVVPGPLIHYTFISNVLNNELLYSNPIINMVSLLFFLLLPFVWFLVSSIYQRVLIYGLSYFVFFTGSKLAFIYLNLCIDTFYPLLGLVLLAMTSEIMLHKAQEKQSRFIEGAFSSYLSPVLLKKLMEEPERLVLGGEKKELTIFFSDIRSFTSISETMDPQRLTTFLNRYFTPMSDIVLKHQGMIDKYIGDAVMAFYNAPLDVKEHAASACRSALEMIDELEKLNKTFNKEGLPKIAIGIGLNTAEVVVGNMGSAKRFNYTVIGDGVNLASRVEGLNKVYGTHILITEFTKACIGDEFLTRELERVKVKGKEEAVMLYELLKDTSANRELCQEYDAAMRLYKEGKVDEAVQAFAILKDDRVSGYFAEKYSEAVPEKDRI